MLIDIIYQIYNMILKMILLRCFSWCLQDNAYMIRSEIGINKKYGLVILVT